MNVGKPQHELSIGEILSLTFSLYFSKFLQFFFPLLIGGIIMGLSSYVITSSFPLPSPPSITDMTYSYEELVAWLITLFSAIIMIGVLSALVSWLVGTTVTGIVVKSASDQIEKGSMNLGTSLGYVASKLPSLLVAQLISGILVGIGLFLFIVPGIIIAIMFSPIIPTIIIEQEGALASLGRSRKLVSNRWLKTFTLLLVIGLILVAVSGVGLAIAPLFSVTNLIFSPLIYNIVFAFVGPIYPIATTYLYYAMAVREIPPPPPPPTL